MSKPSCIAGGWKPSVCKDDLKILVQSWFLRKADLYMKERLKTVIKDMMVKFMILSFTQ